jgi:large subunit ribosomal protein L9
MARNVQVILTEDLPNVGRSGEVVRVKPGYARNFLIPRGLAAIATADNVHRLEHEKRVAQKRAQKQRSAAEELALKLANVRITLQAQVGEEDRLYGAITSRDVEAALADKGFEIDRRKIVMEPIKELGTHKVPIRIAAGIDAGVELEIVARK